MGLRRYMKTGERETFLVVFIVLAGLAAYLGSGAGRAPAPAPLPPLVASDGGMEKLWLEASMVKGDMRPIPDELSFEEGPVPEAAPAAPPPEPAPAAPEPEPAAFPTPLPAASSEEAAERPRIAPMSESLLNAGRSGSSSSAFLAFPKSAKETRPASTPAASASPAAPAPSTPPKRRVMRPLAGN